MSKYSCYCFGACTGIVGKITKYILFYIISQKVDMINSADLIEKISLDKCFPSDRLATISFKKVGAVYIQKAVRW